MGNPDVLYVVYAVKIVLFVLGGMCFALATKGIDGWGNVTSWWSEPIVFQKVVLWALLFEVLGLGCGFGPLTGKFKPPMGSVLSLHQRRPSHALRGAVVCGAACGDAPRAAVRWNRAGTCAEYANRTSPDMEHRADPGPARRRRPARQADLPCLPR
jgi:hypothetical protein